VREVILTENVEQEILN